MIIIHAFFKVDPNHRQDFIKQARQVGAPSQAEEGNISYHFYEDPEQPNSFVFLEKWKDQEAITLHEETSHFKSFGSDVQDVLLEPIQVEVYEASAKL
ncbi:antibiotic biosynthesis monooxygenase [Peribacillus cavernae]|uniref:Antibiotic biosynthesis monooxygenase n=1 Tax=Peribacillus cavernae TaxID=1674310 RepID=A0A3S0W0S2_9BACI|nr:putative quinol monooxygenase [Peribacillus cavernae]MDQ0217416.1 quinol monooxygenase YgiN [Peribacillus cavernae]RUQ30136.1 antibiotic biosynthesis monooxygenase [Peribacillus cavernae]